MENKAPNVKRSLVRFRRIVFTLNNWTDEEFSSLISFPCNWMVIGKEVGSTGTKHLQGAIILGKQMTLNQLKATKGLKRAHIEQMKGSPQQSLVYCTKEDLKAFQKGELPSPGTRSDLKSVIDAIREGRSLRELANDDNYDVAVCRNYKSLTVFRTLLVSERRTKPTVVWIHGDTGTGKTRSAVEFAEQYGAHWISNGPLKWFDGYCGEPCVILDDIRADSCSFDFLLRLLDRYPLRVEFKGGFVDWIPKIILVTCPMSPSYLFNLKGQGDVDQLERRIDKVLEYGIGKLESNTKQLLDVFKMDNQEGVDPTPKVDTPGPRPIIDLTNEESSDTSTEVMDEEVAPTQEWKKWYEEDDANDAFYTSLNRTFY